MNDPAPRFSQVRSSAEEFLLTFCLLLGVTTIVRWIIGPSAISEAIPTFRRRRQVPRLPGWLR